MPPQASVKAYPARPHSCRGRLLPLLLLFAVGGVPPAAAAGYAPTFGQAPPSARREYVVGIAPFHNPRRLFAVYGPLIAYLNAQLQTPGVELTFEASRNHAAFVRKLEAGHFAFALLNPYQTLIAIDHGYRVFGKMGADSTFSGTILVRRDSRIDKVTDLKGKAVSFPSPIALAATIMPQYFFARHGLDVVHDIRSRYVGSMESSVMNLYLGNVAAACLWTPQWHTFKADHPEEAATLRVQWVTPPLIDNGLVARADVPAMLVRRVGRLLFSLRQRPEGPALLARIPLNRFEPATDATYQPVRRFLADFARKVRPLEQRP